MEFISRSCSSTEGDCENLRSVSTRVEVPRHGSILRQPRVEELFEDLLTGFRGEGDERYVFRAVLRSTKIHLLLGKKSKGCKEPISRGNWCRRRHHHREKKCSSRRGLSTVLWVVKTDTPFTQVTARAG